jgi:hypothetical protein
VARATRVDVVALLLAAGADPDSAERIVGALERAGLDPPRMRTWLRHPRRAYSVHPAAVVIADEETWPGAIPTHAIEMGRTGAVLTAAQDFAAADPDERAISSTFLCTLEQVRRLTHEDPARTEQVAEVARLLIARLGKDTIVNEVLQTRLSPRQDPEGTRLVDCLLDHRLTGVLQDLRSGQLDPAALDRERDLDFYGW